MPTILTHAVAGLALGRSMARRPLPRRTWWLLAGCAMLPDLDTVGLLFGVPYGSLYGHRGLFHSLAFALIVALAVVATGYSGFAKRERWSLVLLFFVATASHGLLDCLTDGGRGVALLAPVELKRYFFGWRPIHVSPIGLAALSAAGLRALLSEIIVVWLPAALLTAVTGWLRRNQRKS